MTQATRKPTSSRPPTSPLGPPDVVAIVQNARRPVLGTPERAVLGLARLGWGEAAMAMLLGIDEQAASATLARAVARLGAETSAGAVEVAQRLGMLS